MHEPWPITIDYSLYKGVIPCHFNTKKPDPLGFLRKLVTIRYLVLCSVRQLLVQSDANTCCFIDIDGPS